MSTRQDHTTYSTAGTGQTRTTAAVGAIGISGTHKAYGYKDFTADYFSGDFEHTLKLNCGSADSLATMFPWGMANTAGCLGTMAAATPRIEMFYTGQAWLSLEESNGTNLSAANGTSSLATNTDYFVRVCRDESQSGTGGNLYAYIYSNAAMTELVETISLTLRAAQDFRYLYDFSSYGGAAATSGFSGTSSNLTLDQHPYTLEAMVSYLRTILDEVTASYFTDAQLKLYINHAQRDIAALSGCIRHIDTATVTNTTRTVAFSGYKCAAVEYAPTSGNAYYLRKILPKQVNHVKLDGAEPQYWYEFGSNIGIEPLPAATYTNALKLYIEDFPTAEMSVDTEIPQIPPAFQPLIIYKALQQAFIQDNKLDVAKMVYTIYRNELAYLMQDQLQNVPDGTNDLRYE